MGERKHLYLSKNGATGRSLNLSPKLTCKKRCKYCYGCFRNKKLAERYNRELGLPPGTITANTGPITWELQQKRYEWNTRFLNSLTIEGIAREAKYIARCMDLSSVRDNLRFFGCGDATQNAMLLALYLGAHGKQAWGFSKQEDHVRTLAMWCDGVRGPEWVRPHFLMSIDRFTSDETIGLRIDTGIAMNQVKKVLSYMAFKNEDPREIQSKWWFKHVRTVLGYHATQVHTVVGIKRECPKTSLKGITCQQCRRCMSYLGGGR